MSDPQDISEDEALVAEYVLRLLDAEAERDFEKRLADDAGLRAQVHFWEAEFASLAEDLPEIAPPASVKAGLMAEITAPTPRPVRHWLLGWLAIPTLLVMSLIAVLVFVPFLRAPNFDPAYHASLASADGTVHIEAGYAPDNRLFRVIHEAGEPQSGRDYELWVIGEGAPAPVSLGIVTTGREVTFEITEDIAELIKGGTLAVSDEPAGGSPTGAPTGDILATAVFFDV